MADDPGIHPRQGGIADTFTDRAGRAGAPEVQG
jgi:hypothetical protein